MTSERWRQVEAIFDAACQVREAERAAYLDRICGADVELRAEVESLLAADGRAGAFLASGIQRQAESLSRQVSAAVIGRRIGPYRITSVLGRGGMGSVYQALREDDVYERPVALKLIKRGLDTDEVVERFRRERRILSRLDHPNIARLLDGGATEEGLPYLVMEYVEGTPLLEYARTMDLNARLDLFRKVCEGVGYAHRNLVIHRDLKPANILVTAETGAPKLLDFGIAKLLSSEDSSHTSPEQRLLTPDYASPEQKTGALVTTATDIYSLGRILEELVKGVKAPYEVAQITGKSRHEDAERRYATVEQLSEDVRRYLAGLPVLARGDAALYRARKFLRRNLWTVLAATAAMISLLAGIVVSTIQARRAERQFHAAHGFANLVVRDISRRLQQTRGALGVAKDLIGGTVRMLDALSKDAANDRALQFDLGVGYFRVSSLQWSLDGPNLGEFDGCMENAGKARDILEPLLRLEPGNRDVQHQLGQVYKQLGWCSWGAGDYEDEIRWARKAEPLLRASDPYPETGYGSNQHFTIPGDIGGALVQLGRCREALKIYRYRPGVARDVLARFGIGSALECEGDIDGAEKQYSGVTYDGKRLLGGLIATDQVIFVRGNLLGNPLQLNLGLRDEGLKLVRQSLMRHETVFQRDPADMFAKILLAQRYRSLGEFLEETDVAEAAAAYAKAIELQDAWCAKSTRNRPSRIANARTHAEMSSALLRLGRMEEAKAHLTRASEIENSFREPQGFTHLRWGDYWLAAGDRSQADASYRRGIEVLQAELGRRPEPMPPRRELADAYERLGALNRGLPGACEWFEKSLDVWRNWTKWGPTSSYRDRREHQAASLLAACSRENR